MTVFIKHVTHAVSRLYGTVLYLKDLMYLRQDPGQSVSGKQPGMMQSFSSS